MAANSTFNAVVIPGTEFLLYAWHKGYSTRQSWPILETANIFFVNVEKFKHFGKEKLDYRKTQNPFRDIFEYSE